MKKNTFLLLSILFVSNCFAQVKQDERPNILWIVSEDNTTLLGCYGDKKATTPNIDQFAKQSILYENAFCTAPVCAPSRFTLITGMYPTTMGTENMRSVYPIPDFIQFFPKYLRQAGYYTTNNAKKDYNTTDQPDVWNESSNKATYKNRKPGQPFFAVFNIQTSHESSLHKQAAHLRHNPNDMRIPAYQPGTPEMKHDWAQYYDKVEDMDQEVGAFLKELDEAGLAENTIVFYYGDNGGVLPRSKRFMYESGLHVPLIVRVPKKFAGLAPKPAGTKTDQIVTFVDFAPTVLSLTGIKIPSYFQGHAFLGKQQVKERDYAYAFRGRMDERIDLVRAARDKKYLYVRNFYPHKIYAQYIEYLWNAPSMKSWEAAYKSGELNEVQSRFFKTKPVEELYDCQKDPDNVFNLAGKKEYQSVLSRMRSANEAWIINAKDAGFIPEARKEAMLKKSTVFDYTHSGAYNISKVLRTASMASSGEVRNLQFLVKNLNDQDPDVRYWAATGCTILGKKAASAEKNLAVLLTDREPSVQIAAAEALYKLGTKEKPLQVLLKSLTSNNMMARIQALNVLEACNKKDITMARADLHWIVTQNKGEYDVRAAKRILSELTEE